MRKIIVKTDRAHPDLRLLSWLQRLFPECEIGVVSSRGQIETVVDGQTMEERSGRADHKRRRWGQMTKVKIDSGES